MFHCYLDPPPGKIGLTSTQYGCDIKATQSCFQNLYRQTNQQTNKPADRQNLLLIECSRTLKRRKISWETTFQLLGILHQRTVQGNPRILWTKLQKLRKLKSQGTVNIGQTKDKYNRLGWAKKKDGLGKVSKKKLVEFSTKRGGRGSGLANFPLRKT